jgi:hypothetical protein
MVPSTSVSTRILVLMAHKMDARDGTRQAGATSTVTVAGDGAREAAGTRLPRGSSQTTALGTHAPGSTGDTQHPAAAQALAPIEVVGGNGAPCNAAGAALGTDHVQCRVAAISDSCACNATSSARVAWPVLSTWVWNVQLLSTLIEG